jgi:hypothetical protein
MLAVGAITLTVTSSRYKDKMPGTHRATEHDHIPQLGAQTSFPADMQVILREQSDHK